MSFMKDFDYLKIQKEDVVLATNNFDPTKVIGCGGFGRVYRGELSSPEGQITFAFKRLDRRLGQGEIEFWKEIMMLSEYKHKNLISLNHFCIEGDEMILVYEYASLGSLDRYLIDANTLTWIRRLKICVGAAHGLYFLHDPKGTQQRVIHRDVKSANILLDENWTAKVSDFGLSKVGPANQAHTYLVSHGVGTPGYCDPLYWEFGFLSKESDVYSFGVVLFEVLCGRLCYEYRNRELTKILVPKWRRCYEEKRLDEIMLRGLKEQMDPASLNIFSAIAYRCLKKAHEERPMMAEIVKELEFSLEQQEIFENIPESSQRERTSLMLDAQMDQSLDNDRRLKFEPRHVRFEDRADDDYSDLPLPASDKDDFYDAEDGLGIDGFQIIGDAKPQSTLSGAAFAVSGTCQRVGASNKKDVKIPEECVPRTLYQPFINEKVLTRIHKNDILPITAQQFFDLLLRDGSNFINEYRSAHKDTSLNMGQWHSRDEYDGQFREISFRSPRHSAVTEWQYLQLFSDKTNLVFETVQQAQDAPPCGSCFEVHCRWRVQTIYESSCAINVQAGVHSKQRSILQALIEANAINEYTKEVELMLQVARSCINSPPPQL